LWHRLLKEVAERASGMEAVLILLPAGGKRDWPAQVLSRAGQSLLFDDV
jgi:hypothetical protein